MLLSDLVLLLLVCLVWTLFKQRSCDSEDHMTYRSRYRIWLFLIFKSLFLFIIIFIITLRFNNINTSDDKLKNNVKRNKNQKKYQQKKRMFQKKKSKMSLQTDTSSAKTIPDMNKNRSRLELYVELLTAPPQGGTSDPRPGSAEKEVQARAMSRWSLWVGFLMDFLSPSLVCFLEQLMWSRTRTRMKKVPVQIVQKDQSWFLLQRNCSSAEDQCSGLDQFRTAQGSDHRRLSEPHREMRKNGKGVGPQGVGLNQDMWKVDGPEETTTKTSVEMVPDQQKRRPEERWEQAEPRTKQFWWTLVTEPVGSGVFFFREAGSAASDVTAGNSTYFCTSAPKAKLLMKMKNMKESEEESEEESEDELDPDLIHKKVEHITSALKPMRLWWELTSMMSLTSEIKCQTPCC